MNLAEIFGKIAYKRLARVDIPNAGSNQHELNGISALKDFFGTQATIKRDVEWHRFSDETEPERTNGQLTFYDARAKSATRTGRTEWRLYYTGDFSLFLLPTTFLCLQQAGQMNGSMLLSSATIPHGIGRLCNFSKS